MFTYFLKNNVNSLIKIGKSVNVERRLQQIKGQCSFIELSVFHVIEGNFEAKFHDYYREFRKEGEWFDIPELTIEKIAADLLAMQPQQTEVTELVDLDRTYPEDVGIQNVEKQPDSVAFLQKTAWSAPFLAFVLTLKNVVGGCTPGILNKINEVKEDIEYIMVEDGENFLYITQLNSMQVPKKSNIGDFLLIVTVKYVKTELKISIGEEEYDETTENDTNREVSSLK